MTEASAARPHRGASASPPWWVRHARLLDVGVAALVFAAAMVGAPPAVADGGIAEVELEPVMVVLLTLSSASLVVRRDAPRRVWAATLVLAVVSAVLADDPGRGLPASVVALYTVSVLVGRRWAVGAALMTMAVGGAVAFTAVASGANDPVTLAVLPWCGLAAALGDAVRVNRQRLDDAHERARVAEQSREEEALRRVAEERLHLSRELHDVIGHHLAVINVQAGVAEHLAASDPAAATAAIGQVRAAAAEALQQTGSLVGLLRTSDEEPREPTPHLDLVPQLVAATRARGASVVWHQRGAAAVDDALVNQHGYRIVQEALTNAVRHGSGPVTLITGQAAGTFVIEVRNPVAEGGSPRPGSGHGLVGMRERAALCGGTLVVERVGPEHVLRAELPLQERPR